MDHLERSIAEVSLWLHRVWAAPWGVTSMFLILTTCF